MRGRNVKIYNHIVSVCIQVASLNTSHYFLNVRVFYVKYWYYFSQTLFRFLLLFFSMLLGNGILLTLCMRVLREFALWTWCSVYKNCFFFFNSYLFSYLLAKYFFILDRNQLHFAAKYQFYTCNILLLSVSDGIQIGGSFNTESSPTKIVHH